MKKKKYNSYFIRFVKGKAGSALIWALAVAIILTIVIAAGLNIVQRQQNQNVQQHIENQAYFSAMSVNRAIMQWLDNTSYVYTDGENQDGDTPQVKFLNNILSNNENEEIALDISFANLTGELPVSLESINNYAKFSENPAVPNEFTITIFTTASYYGDTATVSGVISNKYEAWLENIGSQLTRIEVPSPPASTLAELPPLSDVIGPLNSGNANYGVAAGGNYVIQYVNASTSRRYGMSQSQNGAINFTCNTLVIDGKGTTGQVQVRTSKDININKIIVMNGGELYLSGNGGRFDELVIESGGKVIVDNSNYSGFAKTGGAAFNMIYDYTVTPPSLIQSDTPPILYIKPGGQLSVGDANGRVVLDCVGYIYAWGLSDIVAHGLNPENVRINGLPTRYAAIDFGGSTSTVEFRSLVIEAAVPLPPEFSSDPSSESYVDKNATNDDGSLKYPHYPLQFEPSYSAILSRLGGLTPVPGSAVHIPEGFADLDASTEANRQFAITTLRAQNISILRYSCNHTGDGNAVVSRMGKDPSIDPFCPHFLAKNAPPIQKTSNVWQVKGHQSE